VKSQGHFSVSRPKFTKLISSKVVKIVVYNAVFRLSNANVECRALVIVLPCYGALEIVGVIIIIIIIIDPFQRYLQSKSRVVRNLVHC